MDTGLSVDELMDTAVFKKFNSAIDNVLEAVEDIDLTELNAGTIQPFFVACLAARTQISSNLTLLKSRIILLQVTHVWWYN